MTPSTHLEPTTIDAFIDAELSLHESQTVQQHLADCHSCTLRVLSATQLKAATARAASRFVAPPDALARLTAQLQQPAQQPKKQARLYTFPSIAWTALAAALILTISLIAWRHSSNTLAAELLDQHLSTLSSAAAPQVISTDRHTVKPWFQGKLPFSFNLPEPTALPPDTTLKGANLTYIDHQPAALLLFTIHKHEVSVFLTQPTGTAALPTARSGFSIDSATTPGLRIVAVSDVSATDLDALVKSLVSAQ